MLSAFFDGYARFEVIVKTLRKEGHTAVAIKGREGARGRSAQAHLSKRRNKGGGGGRYERPRAAGRSEVNHDRGRMLEVLPEV